MTFGEPYHLNQQRPRGQDMTRKHLEALATIVRDFRQAFGNQEGDFLMHELARLCQDQNPRFDLALFENRCSA